MDEPLSLRLSRFLLWMGTFGLLLFLLSDYAGYPQYEWLFWIMLAFFLGFLLRQRGLWVQHQQRLERRTSRPTGKEKKK